MGAATVAKASHRHAKNRYHKLGVNEHRRKRVCQYRIESINRPGQIDMKKPAKDEVCTPQQTARILGMPVRSVQQMIERGELPSTKTSGGHSRISFEAIDAYKAAEKEKLAAQSASNISSILIVEDSQMQRLMYKTLIGSWNLPVSMTFCEHGYQALLEVATGRFDILLADIVMEGMDGYEVIKNVISNSYFSHLHVAVLSSLDSEALEMRGKLPDSVVMFKKPIIFDELRGYLRACCASKARMLTKY